MAWAEADDRVGALVIYGSVARGTEGPGSDLDVIVVARPGDRESLWAERASLAEKLLAEPVGYTIEPSWQRPYRFSAYPVSFTTMIDLTVDEGSTLMWRGLAAGLEIPVDRLSLGDELRAEARSWVAPEPDVGFFDATVWPWFAHLHSHLAKGHVWMVRAGLYDTLGNRVVALLGADPDTAEAVLSQEDYEALTQAAPRSSDPDELRRALVATVELYDYAVDSRMKRAGSKRPSNPMAPVIRARVGAHAAAN